MTPRHTHFAASALAASALLAIVLALLLPPASHAFGLRPHRNAHGDQQQVLHVEEEVRSALLTADASTLDKVLADDFLGISANGTLSDKQQYLRRIGQKEHQFSRIDVVDRKVRLQSASAIVVTTAQVIGRLDSTPIHGEFRYTRVYSREADGSWKLRNFEATRVSGAMHDEMNHGVPVARNR